MLWFCFFFSGGGRKRDGPRDGSAAGGLSGLIWGIANPGPRTKKEEGTSFIGVSIVIVRRSHQDVIIVIPINIAGTGHTVAKLGIGLIKFISPTGIRVQTRGRAIIDIGSASSRERV